MFHSLIYQLRTRVSSRAAAGPSAGEVRAAAHNQRYPADATPVQGDAKSQP